MMTTQMVDRPGVDPLLMAAAAAELAGLRKLRAVTQAAESGRPQREIAARLDVSQAAVHKMLVKARHTPGLSDGSPWEIALRYAAGEIGHAQMLEEFTAWPWTHDRVLDADSGWPEQFAAGDWAQLERAARVGYVSQDDYALVFERTR